MSDEKKDASGAATNKGSAPIRRDANQPTYRTVLIAASVGVLIGLLLKR